MSDGERSWLRLLLTLGLGLTVGGFCFDYILESALGKDVPWYLDAIAGAVLVQWR